MSIFCLLLIQPKFNSHHPFCYNSCNRFDYLTNKTSSSTIKYESRDNLVILKPKTPRRDGQTQNRGAPKQVRLSVQDKYEQCEEAIASNLFPTFKTPTKYFRYYHPNHVVAHKWLCQYGKWTKPDHREKMANQIIGKIF